MSKIAHFLSGLITDNGSDKISVGRISWWIVSSIAVYRFAIGEDITSNHLTILLILATYNFGKKVVDRISARKKEEPQEEE